MAGPDPPALLTVLGGGVLGVEFAYISRIFGSRVRIVEKADRLIPGLDPDVSREAEVERVCQEYGFKERFELELPATALDTLPRGDVVSAVSRVLERVRPTVLYLPFGHDVHSDHQVAFQALYSASKSFRQPWIKRILMGEAVSETEFAPPLGGTVFAPTTSWT